MMSDSQYINSLTSAIEDNDSQRFRELAENSNKFSRIINNTYIDQAWQRKLFLFYALEKNASLEIVRKLYQSTKNLDHQVIVPNDDICIETACCFADGITFGFSACLYDICCSPKGAPFTSDRGSSNFLFRYRSFDQHALKNGYSEDNLDAIKNTAADSKHNHHSPQAAISLQPRMR